MDFVTLFFEYLTSKYQIFPNQFGENVSKRIEKCLQIFFATCVSSSDCNRLFITVDQVFKLTFI